MLSLVQAQDYIRIRLQKVMNNDEWHPREIYQLIDRDNKGWFNAFDIERLVKTNMRTKKSLHSDLELVLNSIK